MRKQIAVIIASSLVIATTVTLLVVLLPQRFGNPQVFDWEFPTNSTYYNYYVKVPFNVPMRDGTKLATDVFVPIDINESLPVIFVRTPYGRDMLSLMSGYTSEGYVVVLQDFRGFYESEGEIGLPFFTEQTDGHDSLTWIDNQPWSNGKIGTWGLSALGIAQYLMAPNAPDSLKCQLPIVATPDTYKAMFRGGEFRNELVVPWLEDNNFPQESLDIVVDHEKLDSMWQAGRIVNNYSNIQAASLHMGGWYDILTQGTIDAFVGYQYSGGDGARGNAKLVMGPWTHTGMLGGSSGEIMYPNQNIGILLSSTDALFEKWLKDNSTLWNNLPTVSFYLMSSIDYNPLQLGNNWFKSDKWPLSSTVLDLFLHPENDMLLSGDSPIEHNGISYYWDGLNYTTTIGGGNLALPAGTYDQRPVEGRDDVLLFSTPAFTEPLTIVGQINATLFIESNCTDTDFTVKLTDVYPDNRSMLITDTIIRARNRNSFSDWEFLIPGEIYEIQIPLDSTAYVFNEGHKLQIAISSSNFPRFEVNPNTGDPLWQNETTYVANNTIHVSAIYPSRISVLSVDYDSLVSFSFYDISYSFETLNELDKERASMNQQPSIPFSITTFLIVFSQKRKIIHYAFIN